MMSFFSLTDWQMIFLGILVNRIFLRIQPRLFLKIAWTIILPTIIFYQAKRSHWIYTCRSSLNCFLFLHGSGWPLFWNCLIFFIHVLWFLLLFLFCMLLNSNSDNFITITSNYIQITVRNSTFFWRLLFLNYKLSSSSITLEFVYLWDN